jgi:TniQ
LRLASINYYPSPTWILNIALIKMSNKNSHENSRNQIHLSQLMRLELSRFIEMLPSDIKAQNLYQYNKFAIKLCPHCLSEDNYCRSMWDCEILLACPRHQCLLISKCPKCQKNIKWSRHSVSQCQCGFDFRHHHPPTANKYQLLLARYLHILDGELQYLTEDEEFYGQNNPLFELSIQKFLQFEIFFFPYVRAYLRHHQWSHQHEPIFLNYQSDSNNLTNYELILILFHNWRYNLNHILVWYQTSLQTLKTKQNFIKSIQDLLSELYSYFPTDEIFHQFIDSYNTYS